MNGVVTGGWNFVVAAYGITVAVLAVYAGTVFSRLRSEVKNATKADRR